MVDCTFSIAYAWSYIYSSHPINHHQTRIQESFQQYLSTQFLNRKIFEYNALATPKTNQN